MPFSTDFSAENYFAIEQNISDDNDSIVPEKNDSVAEKLPAPVDMPVRELGMSDYSDLEKSYPIDLKTPDNVQTTVEFDYETNTYILRTKIGDEEIATPFVLSADEYKKYTLKQEMQKYWQEKNAEAAKNYEDKFNITDMKFSLGPADKIFGPGGVQIKTQGSAEITFGIKHNNVQNYLLSERLRKTTTFDFDEKIQINMNASVGDKIKFNLNYDTESTFDFDRQNLKLAYEGKEDDWLKKIEAGNVSMNVNSALIPGSTALFGIKSEMQFGKLKVEAVVSQQQSSSQNVNTNGGARTIDFEIPADQYDANRHYFLAHYFREHYDENMKQLPYITSGVTISRIEVWVTNKRARYEQARNIIAFTDLAETKHISNQHWNPTSADVFPKNNANTLYEDIKNIANVRDIQYFTQAMANFGNGLVGGEDYEKIESARRLEESEYTLNSTLGFISLRQSLNADEVLAVAFEYTLNGEVYRVGEFSTGGINAPNSLIVKLLKGTSLISGSNLWKLMMKNIYALGASSFQQENFKLNVLYKNDSTGAYLNYIPVGNIKDKVLLKVMNLDRLDTYNNPRSDGKFDFVEGYTIISSMGRVIFPVEEPFGKHLAQAIGTSDSTKYCFQALYDSTLVAAGEVSEKNKFKIAGSFQGTSNSEIYLNAMNVPRGSVTVTSGGITLVENVDYTVDYIMGVVTILNQSVLASNTPVDVRMESRDMFQLQRKTLLGAHLEYAFNKDFTIGGTIMHLSEMPIVTKTMMGSEPISNTIWGLNMAYKKDMQWLTTALDKLPLLEASAPSSITFNGEVAQMIPGHRKIKNNPGYAYVDDFEATETSIDLHYQSYWALSSAPANTKLDALLPEAILSNNIDYGKNRALLAWYTIDNSVFNMDNSSLMPTHLKNDKNLLSNHLTRRIPESEVFPNRQSITGQTAYLPVLNISYYPTERGPYNLDVNQGISPTSNIYFDGILPDGKLRNPKKRWGGMMRKIETSDFEQANIEYIEFWLMDPFVNDSLHTHTGGDLYLNLGDISEDVLKDGKKYFENGMPADGDTLLTESTKWGRVPTQQSTVLAFAADQNSRKYQDVGFNGLRTEEEFNFPTYKDYIQQLRAVLSPATIAAMEGDQFSPLNDPAGDNYHYYRGADYDNQELPILQRYKHFNGTEGNSAEADNNGENFATSATAVPDAEDINRDNTLNEYEKYFQYKIPLRRDEMEIGYNYIVDFREAEPKLANGVRSKVKWYQYKIPLREGEKIGGIRDFKSIRFVRMFLTNFEEEIHLRFGSLQLVRGEWRTYKKDLYQSQTPPATQGAISVSSVNVEENGGKEPVNYIMPPGVERETDPSQPQLRQQNEQAMVMRIYNLASGDARAVYKKIKYDLRQFKRLQMFVHAEKMLDDIGTLDNQELAVFLRVGSDHTNNYYEYEIPLNLTPQGRYPDTDAGREQVWRTDNMFNFPLEVFTDLKKKRNIARNSDSQTASLLVPFSLPDPDKQGNIVTIMGNPNLGEIETMMIGVRNKSKDIKTGEIWVNELRLTDYNEDGGWAALGNVVIALSDFANVNLSGRYEGTGFGGVEQSLNERRLDDYYQFNVATQVQLGRLLPEKAKVNIPVYYSYSIENSKPKYSPLDGDMLLKDALETYEEQGKKDSVLAISQTRTITESFNVTGVKIDIRGKRPHFYDPANLSLNYAYTKSQMFDPETERNENINHQGSINYDFNTSPQTWEPFKDSKKMNRPMWKIVKDLGINYSPKRVALAVNVQRMYSETQLRDLEGSLNIDPRNWENALFSSSKNFTWNRTFNLAYDLTKNLQLNFQSATNSRIDETLYSPVNKNFFPKDIYENWKDTVLQSLKHLGTPLMYQQTFSAAYKVPLEKIPFLDWIAANASYNSSYNWNLGAVTSSNINLGNVIANSANWQIDGQLKMETLYNKSKYLKTVNQKYQSRGSGTRNRFNPKTIEKKVLIPKDTSVNIKHGLNSTTLDILAKNKKGKKVKVSFKVVDKNTVAVSGKEKDTITLSITTRDPNTMQKITGKDVLMFSTRFLMMVRNASITYRESSGMTLPGFIGDPRLFGQSKLGTELGPGLDFAFGMPKESYIEKARDKGWIASDSSIINPAALNKVQYLDIKANIEPIAGLKINLTAQRNATSNYTLQNPSEPTSLSMFSGTYQMTHIAMGTAFWTKNVKVGNVRSYDLFNNYRDVMADRLQQKYNGTHYPTTGFLKEDPANPNDLSGKPYDAANGAFTANSTDVMIPAFLAAYSGRSVGKASTNIIPSLWSLLPNWTVSYDGLTRIPAIAKALKSVMLNHSYQSSYGINSYTSYANFVTNDDNLGFICDDAGNPIPSSGYDIAGVQIQENFAPFIGIDVAFKNSFTGTLKFNKSRVITLNITSLQIAENYTNEIVVGFGYIIKDFDVMIKLKTNQIKRVKNDLTTRLDFSFKDMSMLLRKIDTNEPPQATSGNKTISVRFTADYVFSSKLNFRLFVNYQSNTPLITTSYPISTVDAGLSIKFLLTR
ncbi:MAG: cell surface protein SprA [Prevotellaceae bacterium]|jgi:cell surface protein SprA|nr:cell surface protein SprA [Prevotellaceae bacterium]